MSTYAPGTVAMIGWPMTSGQERAFTSDGCCWVTESGVSVHEPTSVRPLVVLDLDGTYGCWADQGDPAVIIRSLRETNSAPALAIADQIEAQTKPPRIDEPGLWGVVATQGGLYVRHTTSIGQRQWSRVSGDGHALEWSELIDPTLIREGVTE